MMSEEVFFEDLDLSDDVLDALYDMRFEKCTPVQAQCIPPIIEGRDVLGVAQTGTGKTAAYLLPLLTLLQTDDTEPLGKYGRMRLVYLKNQRPVLYNQMLLNGTLWPHLQDVQKTACAWLERTMNALLDKYPRRTKNAHSFSGWRT